MIHEEFIAVLCDTPGKMSMAQHWIETRAGLLICLPPYQVSEETKAILKDEIEAGVGEWNCGTIKK